MPMQPKRPRDVSQLAKMMIDMATGESPLPEKPKVKKNEAAVARGRLGGLKGGKARAEKLSPKHRRDQTSKAARKRWGS